MKMVLSVLLQHSVHMIKPLAEEQQPTEHRSFWETQNPDRTAVAAC